VFYLKYTLYKDLIVLNLGYCTLIRCFRVDSGLKINKFLHKARMLRNVENCFKSIDLILFSSASNTRSWLNEETPSIFSNRLLLRYKVWREGK
jgi:hypothetical protein